MYQNCVFVGRTTKNADLFFTASGTAVCNFNLAINRINSTQADFIPCVLWGDKAKAFVNSIGKGTLILIDGEFRTTQYENENKKKQSELKFEVWNFKAMENPKATKKEEAVNV